MNIRNIFMIVLLMIFVGVMTVGLTLLFKDKTKEALEIFSGGAFMVIFVLCAGVPFFMED